MDMSAVASVATSLRAAGDMTKAMLDLRDEAKLREKVIELQGLILLAQGAALQVHASHSEAVDELRQLKSRLNELDAWKAVTSRYELKDFGSGTFAYALRPDSASDEPAHLACPRCFEEQARSTLHFIERSYANQDLYRCLRCKTELALGAPQKPSGECHVIKGGGSWMAS